MNIAPLLSDQNTPRLPLAAIIVLAGIYLLTGVAAHDPWKVEDAIHIGIAYGFAFHGGWLTPAIAGEYWPHTAPLYHWVAALLGRLLDGFLPFHNAARLATTLFGALYLLFLAGAARAFFGQMAGRIAPLLAIGTLGLLVPIHEAQPAIAGLACAALAWWGAALNQQDKPMGAPLLGLGLGLAFLAHGLVGLIMALAVLPAPILRRDWRGLAVTLLIAVPLLALWPLLLLQQTPEYWSLWWHNEFAEATAARSFPVMRHLEQLGWAAWPLWPLALFGLWKRRHAFDQLVLPMIGAALTLFWFFSGAPRSLAVLTVLIPLTLIAAAGAEQLRRGSANAFDWFSVMTFSFFAALIWLGASAQGLGWPPKIASNFTKLAPGHEASFGFLPLAAAIVMTLLWLATWGLRRANWRPSLRWSVGLCLLWVLTATLWMPWIDHATTYRPVVLSLKNALPSSVDCIERGDIGPAQRASLDYFAGIRTEAPSEHRSCSWRIGIGQKESTVLSNWTEVWQGARTSNPKERWYLERRSD
jgi:4-amino-4-deoxy-L-arabinose transferase-like glycosyltransferase